MKSRPLGASGPESELAGQTLRVAPEGGWRPPSMAQGERIKILGGAEFWDPLRAAHAATSGSIRAMACSGCTGSGETILCNDC